MDAQNWSPFKPYFKRLEVSAKTLLLAEGQVSRTMFFIEKGCLRTWINNDGKEITTQFFFEGDSVASIESFRTATARRRIACATSADRAKVCPILYEKITTAPLEDAYKVLRVDAVEVTRRLEEQGIATEGAASVEEIWRRNRVSPNKVFNLIMQ